MSKKIIWFLAAICFIVLLLWCATIFIRRGGWPSSGPSRDPLPLHIEYVDPADGEAVVESQGFCAHFIYNAGLGLGDEPRQFIRYYLDGFDVTRHVQDLTVLEYGYPAPVGEPCYRADKPLSSRWHTVKIVYTDTGGHEFSYSWRFQIVGTGE